MYDIIVILLFWAMVIAPCMVAMNVGAHLYTEDDSEDFIADGSEFESSRVDRLLLPRPPKRDPDDDVWNHRLSQ